MKSVERRSVRRENDVSTTFPDASNTNIRRIGAGHAAALVASEPWAVQIAHVRERAQVELLHYPVPSDKQAPGQTMAVGTIAQCLKRYGEATVITALRRRPTTSPASCRRARSKRCVACCTKTTRAGTAVLRCWKPSIPLTLWRHQRYFGPRCRGEEGRPRSSHG
jgi:hypothetical protein